MEAEEIRSKVTEQLSRYAVQFTVSYAGETARDKWKCDAWRFTFTSKAGHYSGDYFTGLGHRKALTGAPCDKGSPNTLYREEWEKRWLKPQAPRAADVLYSLILDAGALDQSFSDWCADFGLNEDSIKDLNSYRACCEAGKELRRIFTRAQLTELAETVREL